jgi:hypothetical protein
LVPLTCAVGGWCSTIERMQRTQGYQNDMANAGAIVTFFRFGSALERFTAQLNASVVPVFLGSTEPVPVFDAPEKVSHTLSGDECCVVRCLFRLSVGWCLLVCRRR